MICFVSAAMCASRVGGDDGTNGGLWCSPMREDVEADLVRSLRDPNEVADPLGLALGLAGDRVGSDVADGEDSELHDVRLSAVAYRR